MLPVRNCRLVRGAAIVFTLLLILSVSPLTTVVLAHKVNVFAWVEGDTVYVEGYFAGKKKARNSLVEVFNTAGTKLLQGKTNDNGEYSFKIPEKTGLKIVLTAGMGHKNDFIIPASDLGETAPSQSFALPSPEHRENAEVIPDVNVDMGQLESMITRVLDQKLTPVMKLIRDTRREGPTVTEIFGGIGYIFGLFGVAVYFGNRRKRKGQQ